MRFNAFGQPIGDDGRPGSPFQPPTQQGQPAMAQPRQQGGIGDFFRGMNDLEQGRTERDPFANAWSGYSKMASGIGQQIGGQLNANAANVADNRSRIDGLTSQMGLLPFSMAPADNGQFRNNIPTSWDSFLGMNRDVQKLRGEDPMFKARVDFGNKLLASLFGGGLGGMGAMAGGGLGGGQPAYTTNFGASGGFQ